MSPTRAVAVIGAGPAGLMAAEVLVQGGVDVTVYERMPSAGRKFLLAGRGGLNLTHSEPWERFLTRYGSAGSALRPALELFSPAAMRAWCEALGQPTFVGSSGRVFPASLKTSPLLRAWLRRLDGIGVRFRMRHHWTGWGPDGALSFETPQGRVSERVGAVVLALGGASWPQLGSDGRWTEVLAGRRVAVTPLRPANCGFTVAWSDVFRDKFEGQPLKGIDLSFAGHSGRGEAVVTRAGLEGGAVYAVSAPLRDAIAARGSALVSIDLRPDLTPERLAERLRDRPAKQSLSTFLRKAVRLAPVAIGLMQEARLGASKPLSSLDPDRLARFIRAVPVRLTGTAPIERAISTAGGVAFDGLDPTFMLSAYPGVFLAGEMLDWEAPTGGYLLQACFATGATAAHGALAWLGRNSPAA